MQDSKFALVASIVANNLAGIERVLADLIGVDGILRTEYGFRVRSTMEGMDAGELNRTLLASLRRVDPGTSLRSEWTRNGTTLRFVDYEPESSGLTGRVVDPWET